jgi:hypothetical protein
MLMPFQLVSSTGRVADMAGIGDSTLFPNSKMAAAVQLGQSRFRSGEITSVQQGGGAPVAATFDPATATPTNVTLSNGNLSATHFNSSPGGVRVSIFKNSGKYYFEITNSVQIGSLDCVGFQTLAGLVTDVNDVTNVLVLLATVTSLYANNNDAGISFGGRAIGDRWGIAIDFNAHLTWFRKNGGTWNVSGTANPATGTGGIAFTAGAYAPFVRFPNAITGEVFTANFGATAYTDTVPSGFANWPSS